MKKKLLVLTLVLLLAVGVVAVSAAAEPALPVTCPHCEQEVTWQPLTEDMAENTEISEGHYYLAFEAEADEWTKKNIIKTVCIYMNGKTVTSTEDRLFAVSGELSLIGEGSAIGRGFSTGSSFGGAINITGVVNIYGATVTTTGEEGRSAARGGVVYVDEGELNIYSGSVIGGHASNGGTVGIDNAVVNVYGGSVGGGETSSAGGSVYIRAGGTLNVAGGTVAGGVAGTTGGAVHVHENATLQMSAGSITGGEAGTNGGTVYFRGSTGKITGGTLGEGKAGNAGGSMYIYKGCNFEMTGGSITAGHKDMSGAGSCVWVPKTSNLTLSGDASIKEIRFESYTASCLTVKGSVSGTVMLRGTSGQADDGVVVGTAENADLHRAKYSVYNTDYYVIHRGNDLVMSTVGYVDPVTTRDGYCEVCKKNVTWMSYSAIAFEVDTYIYTGHYYVESDSQTCDWKPKFIVGDDHVCLDLNGKQLVGSNRAFDVHKGTLNILDSVGGGQIVASGPAGVGTVYGGTIFIRAAGTVNLYGGKLTYQLPADDRNTVTRGGVLYVRGSFNIYGGEVSGGGARAGGNIYVDAGVEDNVEYVGHIGLYGGTVGSNITVPSVSTSGSCIVTRGTVSMSGNPQVRALMFATNEYTPAENTRLHIDGDFAGSVKMSVSGYVEGMTLGTAANVEITGTSVDTAGSATADLVNWNGRIVCLSTEPAALLVKQDGTSCAFSSLAAAVDAATQTDYVVLMADAADLTVNKLLHMDLNGFDITGTVSGTGTLVCMDNTTDDFTVADGVYGKITGAVTCAVAGMTEGAPCSQDNYVMIRQPEGISFHCVRLVITDAVLRPSCAGIYYRSAFYGDEIVKQRVASVGVAMNVVEAPNVNNMHTTSLYTAMGADSFNQSGTSTLLSGVMKQDLTDGENLSRSAEVVYAAAYVELSDGTVLFGQVESTNLQQQAAAINAGWTELTLVQKRGFVEMVEKYEGVMRDSAWSVSNPLSILERKAIFASTDYTPYLAPWNYDVVSAAKADGKIHYYFMAGEGLHISDTQTYKDKWGDSCLVVFPNGQTLLIDVGPLAYAPVLALNLERMGITHLDAILITHPHSDHHNGAFADSAVMGVGLLESITVDKVYYRGGYDLTRTDATLVARTCTDLGIPYEVMDKGDVLEFGQVRMECIWPLEGEGDSQISGGHEVNNMSIVVRFDYGEHSSLFTGDLYLNGEKMILERVDNDLLDVDFLKVPHHGYATSSSIDFIQAVSPEVAMSTGRLPIPTRIRNRYINLGADFLDDRTNGYVEVTGAADGELTYETTRSDSTTEEVPEVNPDENEGND